MKALELTNDQICTFCMALEHLIHAGIPAGDALTLLKEDECDPQLRKMLTQMAKSADNGAPLSAVIRETGAFPAYVAALTQVGERSGKIEQTLQALAKYYESRDRMDRAIRSALLYPAALLAVLLAVAVVLLVWVLPVFNDVYARLGSSLTGLAGVLLQVGQGLGLAMPVICAVIALLTAVFAVGAVRKWVMTRWNRFFGDRGAGKKVLSARFVHGLAMAVSSGMTENEALELAAALSQGEAAGFQARCQSCLQQAEQGKELSGALSDNGFLTPADRRLLDAGNRSGKGEAVLQQIAGRMLEQSEDALERQAGMIEPAVVAAACLLIGLVLLSVMLPLLNIMNAIG